MLSENEITEFMRLKGYEFDEPQMNEGDDVRGLLLNHGLQNELAVLLAKCELEHTAQAERDQAKRFALYRDLMILRAERKGLGV